MILNLKPFDASERLLRWKTILNIDDSVEVADFESVTKEVVLTNTKTRVINQDVLRTRGDEVFFRSTFMKNVLRQTLVRFCSFHRIEYMQGLNELLAPVLTLDHPTVKEIESNYSELSSSSFDTNDNGYSNISHPFGPQLLIFERLMARLSPTTFFTRGVDAIQIQLTIFNLLLMYHEPTLALILRSEGMTPDIYAMSWLITLFARRQPVHRALHIWDILLQLDSPHVVVYLAVALLRSRRAQILNNSADILPEILVSLKFESDKEINAVFADALHLLRNTPHNVSEELRYLGFNVQIPENVREKGLKDLWFRPCLTVRAQEVAAHLTSHHHQYHKTAAEESNTTNRMTSSDHLRFLVLDCRSSVEKQLLDALYIEGSISIPFTVQEEICSLARQKSQLLDPRNADGAAGGGVDSMGIERVFAKSIGGLTTRAAAVLSLLWSAFVTHTTEEVHFAIADDSKGPYQCIDADTCPLNTSYALPYHTACASENLPLRERTPSEHAENLPQFMNNPNETASNTATVSFASALIILGFPRVSIVESEDLQLGGQNELFTFTNSNSFSSLPSAVKGTMRSSGFTCLVHHLAKQGVSPLVINAKYSHMQMPIDYYKEYQVCAFVHELRTAAITYGEINPDFYSGYCERQHAESTALDSTTVGADGGNGSLANGNGTVPHTPRRGSRPMLISKGALASTFTAGLPHSPQSPPTTTTASAHASAVFVGVDASSSSSLNALSSLTSTLSVLTPGRSPRHIRTQTASQRGSQTSLVGSSSTTGFSDLESSGMSVPVMNGSVWTGGACGLGEDRGGVALMRAKLGCSLDVLYKLLLIMSAQKKHHIVRLTTTYFFHSSVPSLRAASPSLGGLRDDGIPQAHNYAELLGAAPSSRDINMTYYHKLHALLVLRDTLKELVSTQRLNTVVDKTSTKANTKIRLLKNSLDQTSRSASRAITMLTKKTTLRSTQRRLMEEAAEREGKMNPGIDMDENPLWKTTQDLSAFFHGEEGDMGLNDSRSSSVLRDSLSVDCWDVNARGRFNSSDSVGLSTSELL